VVFSLIVIAVSRPAAIPECSPVAWIAYKLSLINGPLIVSFLMFFLPAMFLAMLSPFRSRSCMRARPTGRRKCIGLVFLVDAGQHCGSLATASC